MPSHAKKWYQVWRPCTIICKLWCILHTNTVKPHNIWFINYKTTLQVTHAVINPDTKYEHSTAVHSSVINLNITQTDSDMLFLWSYPFDLYALATLNWSISSGKMVHRYELKESFRTAAALKEPQNITITNKIQNINHTIAFVTYVNLTELLNFCILWQHIWKQRKNTHS